MAIRDTRLVERALRERWPIPKSSRAVVIAKLVEVMNDSASSPRERVAACRALISASKANLDGIRTASLVQRFRQDDERFAMAEETAHTLREFVDEIRNGREAEPDP
jgi:hypothetical protein